MVENIQGVITNYPILCSVGLGVLLFLLLVMHLIIKQIKFMIKLGIFLIVVIASILVLGFVYENNGNALPFLN